VSPFSTIRRYGQLCYSLVRNHISLPRLQFSSLAGDHFTFDGHSLSTTSLTRMYHQVFHQISTLLYEDLLFGLKESSLPPLRKSQDIVDNPNHYVIGQGFLISEASNPWVLIRTIFQSQNLLHAYFTPGIEGPPIPRQSAWMDYLAKVEKFKEGFYFLFHQVVGMPKRGSEEIRIRVADTSFGPRNIYYMFDHIACVGMYSKTSHNSGKDKLTVHFLPKSLELLLRHFYTSVATVEAWAVDQFIDTPDPFYRFYLFSSMGQQWKAEKLSQILQKLSCCHLGTSLNMNQLRHILPGIADHYAISNLPDAYSQSTMHAQLGHTADTGHRLYARKLNEHPQLTAHLAKSMLDFCMSWQKLWGFSGEKPDMATAMAIQRIGSTTTINPRLGPSDSETTALKAQLSSIQASLLSLQNLVSQSTSDLQGLCHGCQSKQQISTGGAFITSEVPKTSRELRSREKNPLPSIPTGSLPSCLTSEMDPPSSSAGPGPSIINSSLEKHNCEELQGDFTSQYSTDHFLEVS